MLVIEGINEMRDYSQGISREGGSVGFVPTMGALHDGHLSLVRRSKEENDLTVVSIFVNPAQFGPNEDFERYPRDKDGDISKLEANGADVVFMPSIKDIYPKGYLITVSAGDLGNRLCGVSRPGHFDGVVTIVTKLFNIVRPDNAYFGQKDFQQSVIIKKLAKDLNLGVNIVVCPTVREEDGLAMSSRNTYLSPEERRAALVLYRALKLGKTLIAERGERNAFLIKKEMEELISSETLARIDYVEIVNPDDLETLKEVEFPLAICAAVYIGQTRLIDNVVLEQADE